MPAIAATSTGKLKSVENNNAEMIAIGNELTDTTNTIRITNKGKVHAGAVNPNLTESGNREEKGIKRNDCGGLQLN